ncbi:MAG TPA: ATPase domain-containing protein [Nitrososphaerales archaeon]|nr:ATPase domain-containing protein [Nitrososphaerales archaeon]
MINQDTSSPSLEVASTYFLDFFTAGGRSVLIRGDPGTGKTSLVLQLLDFHSKNGFKSVYMSTRLSAKTLKSHQPWVEVVQGKYGTVPRLEEEQIGFQDSRRMDGVRAISGLRQYLEQVTNPFVVLDSWEGLFFESHTLGVEEISKLVEDYDARFVVVTERREQTDLDYLLDGVVVLRRKFHEERVVREIELKKLRGVSIKQSRFLFTLDSGKFRYLPPFVVTDSQSDATEVGAPLIARRKDYYSSGSEIMDSLLDGGFKRGSMNLLELRNDVHSEVKVLVLRTILSNFVNSGHRILYVPIVGAEIEELGHTLPNLSSDKINENITVLGYQVKERNDRTSLNGDFSEDIKLINSKIEEIRKQSGKPLVVIMAEDALEGLYGAEVVSRDLARSVALLKSNGNIRIQLTSPNALLLQELRALCDTNLRIEMLHGTAVMYAVKPISVLHSIIKEPASRGKLGLVPIV